MKKELSIIYVHYNVEDLIIDSIKSLYKHKVKFELIVVDNSNSKKLQKKLFQEFKKVIYINPKKNLGFGKACNLGARKAKGKYLLFLNPDTKVKNNSIQLMLSYIKKDKSVGVIGPKLLSEDGSIQPSTSSCLTRLSNIVAFSFLNSVWKNNPVSKRYWMSGVNKNKVQEVEVVSGACMLIPKYIFDQVKGFDERFFLYFEENDLCLRIKKLGYKVIFFPKASITHLKGQSTNDKNFIKRNFVKSRFEYSKKHFGKTYAFFSELFLRYITADTIIFFVIFVISFFINTYRMDKLMLFIGDIARDFVTAREVILGEASIPVVGIPSSVTWLHQGPLSQWLVIFALKLTNFNIIAPAILFGFVNALTSGMLFILGKKYFNREIGFLSALIYVSMPIAVVNARMPYHTSLVPFFSVLFFLILKKALDKPRTLPILGFVAGLLLLVELSNIVVIGIVAILIAQRKLKIDIKTFFLSICAFMLGIIPFVTYDLFHGPTYLKFPAWIIYRFLKVFLGTNSNVFDRNVFLVTFFQQVSTSFIPQIYFFSLIIFFSAVIFLIYKFIIKKELGVEVILLWLMVPLLAFILHRDPGTAYFSLLYPVFAIIFAYFFYHVFKSRLSILIAILMCIINFYFLITNSFYINTIEKNNYMPPINYSFGYSYKVYEDIADKIIKNSKGKEVAVDGQGEFAFYKTSLDSTKFLIYEKGGNLNSSAKLKYFLAVKKLSDTKAKLIYKNNRVWIYKYE